MPPIHCSVPSPGVTRWVNEHVNQGQPYSLVLLPSLVSTYCALGDILSENREVSRKNAALPLLGLRHQRGH